VNSYILISRSKKDVSGVLEIWRTEWLRHLEYGLSSDPLSQRRGTKKDVYLGCMRTFGSVEDILVMIEEGDQGEDLRTRVNAIRENLAGIQALRELWEDERLDELVESFTSKPDFEDSDSDGSNSIGSDPDE
jgi:hypothetical protein